MITLIQDDLFLQNETGFLLIVDEIALVEIDVTYSILNLILWPQKTKFKCMLPSWFFMKN